VGLCGSQDSGSGIDSRNENATDSVGSGMASLVGVLVVQVLLAGGYFAARRRSPKGDTKDVVGIVSVALWWGFVMALVAGSFAD
jgi:hypothetical protein